MNICFNIYVSCVQNRHNISVLIECKIATVFCWLCLWSFQLEVEDLLTTTSLLPKMCISQFVGLDFLFKQLNFKNACLRPVINFKATYFSVINILSRYIEFSVGKREINPDFLMIYH